MGQKASKALEPGEAVQSPAKEVGALWQSWGEFQNPTGRIWNGLRHDLMVKIAKRGEIIDLPLYSLQDLQSVPALDLPSHCYGFPLGPEAPEAWPLAVAGKSDTAQQRPALPTSDNEFAFIFLAATNSFFKYVDLNKAKCVVAGGFIEACLSGQPESPERSPGDTDVFFHGWTSSGALMDAGTEVCQSILKAVFEEDPSISQVTLKRYETTLNIEIPGYRTIQLVLPQTDIPPSVSAILHRFDHDICQLAWDGSQLFCTWKALRAWAFQANVFDAEHIMAIAYGQDAYTMSALRQYRAQQSRLGDYMRKELLNDRLSVFMTKSFIRAEKYARRGYALAVPGIPQQSLDAMRAEINDKFVVVDIDAPNPNQGLEMEDTLGMRVFYCKEAPVLAGQISDYYPGRAPRVKRELKVKKDTYKTVLKSSSFKFTVNYGLEDGAADGSSNEGNVLDYEVERDVNKVRAIQERAVQGQDLLFDAAPTAAGGFAALLRDLLGR